MALATVDQYSPLKITHLTQQTILPKLQTHHNIEMNLTVRVQIFFFAHIATVTVEINVVLKPIWDE